MASGGTRSLIETSFILAAHLESIVPSTPGIPFEISTTSELTFERSISTTPLVPVADEPPPRLLSWSSTGMHANEIHDARRLEIFGRRVIRVYCMAFRIFRRIASLTSLSGSMIISLA